MGFRKRPCTIHKYLPVHYWLIQKQPLGYDQHNFSVLKLPSSVDTELRFVNYSIFHWWLKFRLKKLHQVLNYSFLSFHWNKIHLLFYLLFFQLVGKTTSIHCCCTKMHIYLNACIHIQTLNQKPNFKVIAFWFREFFYWLYKKTCTTIRKYCIATDC